MSFVATPRPSRPGQPRAARQSSVRGGARDGRRGAEAYRSGAGRAVAVSGRLHNPVAASGKSGWRRATRRDRGSPTPAPRLTARSAAHERATPELGRAPRPADGLTSPDYDARVDHDGRFAVGLVVMANRRLGRIFRWWNTGYLISPRHAAKPYREDRRGRVWVAIAVGGGWVLFGCRGHASPRSTARSPTLVQGRHVAVDTGERSRGHSRPNGAA